MYPTTYRWARFIWGSDFTRYQGFRDDPLFRFFSRCVLGENKVTTVFLCREFFFYITQRFVGRRDSQRVRFSNPSDFRIVTTRFVYKKKTLLYSRWKKKTFGIFKAPSCARSGHPSKKKSVPDSVSCGDETPTAMYNPTRLRKSFGTIYSSRIKKSGRIFSVDVSRPPRWKKRFHISLFAKIFFSHHRRLAVQRDCQIVRFFPTSLGNKYILCSSWYISKAETSRVTFRRKDNQSCLKVSSIFTVVKARRSKKTVESFDFSPPLAFGSSFYWTVGSSIRFGSIGYKKPLLYPVEKENFRNF